MDLAALINSFTTNVVKAVATLLLTLAVTAFFWGIVEFIWNSRKGDATKAGQGKEFMLWGLIALFVMFSVWGIIKTAQKTLGPEFQETSIKVPSLNFKLNSPSRSNLLPASAPQSSPTSGATLQSTKTDSSGNTVRTYSNGTVIQSDKNGTEQSPNKSGWVSQETQDKINQDANAGWSKYLNNTQGSSVGSGVIQGDDAAGWNADGTSATTDWNANNYDVPVNPTESQTDWNSYNQEYNGTETQPDTNSFDNNSMYDATNDNSNNEPFYIDP